MTKYIVKNCSAFQWSKCNWEGAKHECCSKNDDCPIKQVVEKCLPQSHIPEVDDLKEQILQTLQVEEVE